jgi:hypothetical protein
MKIRVKTMTIILGCSLLALVLLVDFEIPGGFFVSEAQARIGRPATPRSVAGVARRTTRRTIRRTSRYVATLPRGCTTVVIEGTALHHCGGTYYQPYGGRYVVVHVD